MLTARTGVASLLLCLLSLPAAGPAGGEIVIPGSGDPQALLRSLAREYQREHPGRNVVIPESIGSSGGIRGVKDGAVLARTARPFRADEKEDGLHYREFARSPVVFAANLPHPCIPGLTDSQIIRIFSGRIDNWSQLDPSCPNHKIYVAHRETGDSSRTLLEKMLPGFKDIETLAGETIYSTPETVQTIARYPYAIGFLPLSQVVDTTIVVLAYNGATPFPSNPQSPVYPLISSYAFVWKGDLPSEYKDFVEFVLGPRGWDIIRREGSMPVEGQTN